MSESDLLGLRERVHDLEIEITRLQEQKIASDNALVIAKDALEHYQMGSNEWRKENLDQRALFMTQDKAHSLISAESQERRALEQRVEILERAYNASIGKASAFDQVWIKTTVMVGLLIGLATLILHFWK